ncbi:MAG: pyridoxamine 5'-phosphate oxidase family protein [Prevotellaceae bacterium]|nr:pyridoxamine 5'-phosphate oxidase family protein [Prevotellaceae bacterium]
MNHMPQPFINVIKEHHMMTLATCFNDEPYCCSVFYAYMEEEGYFVFSSESSTKHVRDISHNMYVSANIALETEAVGKIQGLQLQGLAYRPIGDMPKAAKRAYMRRFPYAALLNTTFWILEPTWAKLTDNRFGFGKKMTWEKETLMSTDFLSKESIAKKICKPPE